MAVAGAVSIATAAAAEETLDQFLDRRGAEIKAAYARCLASFEGAAKEQVRVAQRAWIVFSNKNEAAAALAGGRRGLSRADLIREAASEVEARTNELVGFFSLPAQDLAACERDLTASERDLQMTYDQVTQFLAADEQEKVRDAQRAWLDFREKSANSHSGDPSGRARIWDKVVINRRRTQEFRDFYLRRLAGQSRPDATNLYTAVPVTPAPLVEETPGRATAVAVNKAATPQPTASAALATSSTPIAAASPAVDPAHARMVSDFKEETRALLATVNLRTIAKPTALKEARPLPQAVSEAISRMAERGREFRSQMGYAEALRSCGPETAVIDTLVAYHRALKALESGDAASAQSVVASGLREHPQPGSDEQKPLWEALATVDALCSRAGDEAARHVDAANAFAKSGKTGDAIREYDQANSIFPDPKTTATIKKLKEESLGL